jgi:hypothetical protein
LKRSLLRAVVTPVAVLALATAMLPPSSGGAARGKMAAGGQSPPAAVFDGPVPRADCGPGSRPEPGLQGQVPVADRESGRSSEGYTCNLEVVGRYGPEQGFEGAEWQHTWYDHCAYYDTRLSGTHTRRGTIVLDVSDPAHPRVSENLTTPAMLDPWESLKVNQDRGLLAGVFVADVQGLGFFDVYDVTGDCAHPKLLASVPVNGLAHEGNWAPDGKTYYATGLAPGTVTAIDVSDPLAPKPLTTFLASAVIHGLGVSADGKRLYLAHINEDFGVSLLERGAPNSTNTNGLGIYDVSEVQDRRRNARVALVGKATWTDGSTGQHAIPVTSGGRPYVVFVDELGHGGPRIIDISDETNPRVVSKLKVEIQIPEHQALAESETRRLPKENGGLLPPLNGVFGYNSHYCNVDRPEEPTVLACSNFESGLRVFDIRDVHRPKEIAYFNPGGDGTAAPGGFGGTYSGYPSAAPRVFVNDGEPQIWFTDQDRGFYVVRFTNGVWPPSGYVPASPRVRTL